MNRDTGIDLDLSSLTADDAHQLRALFTTNAAISRGAGRPPQEGFLIGLAGLMDSYLERLSGEGGEKPSEAAEYEPAQGVDLVGLRGESLLRGARALIGMSEAFAEDGQPELAGVFKSLAGGFAEALQRRARETGPHSAA